MTTKQILFSALILGITGNIICMETKKSNKSKHKKFDQGIHTKLHENNRCNLFECLQPFGCTENDDVLIIEKISQNKETSLNNAISHGIINNYKTVMLNPNASITTHEDREETLETLKKFAKYAETNNAIYCHNKFIYRHLDENHLVKTGKKRSVIMLNSQDINDCNFNLIFNSTDNK